MVSRYPNHPYYRQPPLLEGDGPETDLFHIESFLGKCMQLYNAAYLTDRESRTSLSLVASSKLVKKCFEVNDGEMKYSRMELIPIASDVVEVRNNTPRQDIQLLGDNILHGARSAFLYVPFIQAIDHPARQGSELFESFDRAMLVASLEGFKKAFWVVRKEGFGRFTEFVQAKDYFLNDNPGLVPERPDNEDIYDLMSYTWNSGIRDQVNKGPIYWDQSSAA